MIKINDIEYESMEDAKIAFDSLVKGVVKTQSFEFDLVDDVLNGYTCELCIFNAGQCTKSMNTDCDAYGYWRLKI